MNEIRTFTITSDNIDQRIDVVIAQQFSDLSRTRIQNLIREGHIKANGNAITSSQKAVEGLHLEIEIPAAIDAYPTAQEIPLDILYEDQDLLVINKPVGMVVHPAPGSLDQTLVNALLAHCGNSLSGIGGVKRPGIVHRLDKGTSGLLVVAKNDAAHQGLSEQFSSRTLNRSYQALVWGVLNPLADVISETIGRGPHHRQKMAILTRGGKMAITSYKTKTTFGTTASLVECKLETGRTHQIRVHLTSRGHPLIGDPLYGKIPRSIAINLKNDMERITLNQRPLLHAGRLEFIHPQTQKTMSFTVETPSDFQEALSILTNTTL